MYSILTNTYSKCKIKLHYSKIDKKYGIRGVRYSTKKALNDSNYNAMVIERTYEQKRIRFEET